MLDPSMRVPPDWRCLDARRSSARVWRAAARAARLVSVEGEAQTGARPAAFARKLGPAADPAPTADAALTRRRAERPDLILLGLTLPGRSGLRFLQLRPVRHSRVPSVV